MKGYIDVVRVWKCDCGRYEFDFSSVKRYCSCCGKEMTKHTFFELIPEVHKYMDNVENLTKHNNDFKKVCPNDGKEVYPDQFNNYVCENCGWSPDD